jgi:phage shock protein PspC (stress-responsive transcriptional regulator)
VIGGVCAALAQRLGIEAKVLRIIAVVTAIAFGGLGIALYVAGLLLIPRVDEQYSPLAKAIPAVRSWPKGLLAALVITALVAITWGSGGGPVMVPVVVVGVVLWFTVFRHRNRNAGNYGPEPTPFERASNAWRVRLAEQQVPGFEDAAPQQRWQQPNTDPSDWLVSDNAPPVPAVIKPKRSWRLWGLALALAGVGTGVVALLGLGFGLPTSPMAYFGTVLAALGITGLVAARHGRPPLLIPAIIVTAVLAATGLAPSQSLVDDYTARISNESLLPSTVDSGVGNVNLDLSGLTLTADRTLTIRSGVGDIQLKLPDHLRTTVNWQLGQGDLKGFAKTMQAAGATNSFTENSDLPGPTLTLNVEAGLGDLEVTP